MAEIEAQAERVVDAPVPAVMQLLSDYRRTRRDILPDGYSGWTVVEGGDGAGTRVRYHFKAGPRERDYDIRVERFDAAQGTVVERDQTSTLTTTWTVAPEGDHRSRVRVVTRWQGGSGMGGFFERRFAPTALSRVHGQMLDRLATTVKAGGGGG